jgi:hypothetical protein
MEVEPVIVPLSVQENIYALHDDRGNSIGTGTREVCEVLLYIITRTGHLKSVKPPPTRVATRPNVRSVIAI